MVRSRISSKLTFFCKLCPMILRPRVRTTYRAYMISSCSTHILGMYIPLSRGTTSEVITIAVELTGSACAYGLYVTLLILYVLPATLALDPFRTGPMYLGTNYLGLVWDRIISSELVKPIHLHIRVCFFACRRRKIATQHSRLASHTPHNTEINVSFVFFFYFFLRLTQLIDTIGKRCKNQCIFCRMAKQKKRGKWRQMAGAWFRGL